MKLNNWQFFFLPFVYWLMSDRCRCCEQWKQSKAPVSIDVSAQVPLWIDYFAIFGEINKTIELAKEMKQKKSKGTNYMNIIVCNGHGHWMKLGIISSILYPIWLNSDTHTPFIILFDALIWLNNPKPPCIRWSLFQEMHSSFWLVEKKIIDWARKNGT